MYINGLTNILIHKVIYFKFSIVDALYGKVMLIENKCSNKMDVDLPQTVGHKTLFNQLKMSIYPVNCMIFMPHNDVY